MTGEASGVFVVDCDVKGGVDGIEQFKAFLGGAFPSTLTVATGSGGLHFYFKHPGFRVAGRKLATGIDIKGDKADADGLVYVVGPGSPGFVKTDDPCVVRPALHGYEVLVDAPIEDAPDLLLAWLKIGGGNDRDAFSVEAIDETHVDWAYRLRLGEEAAKTMPPSKGDGEGGKRLLAICLRLVRALELPLEKCFELIVEHFNPRCTNSDGSPWPWDDDDIVHKLEDARDKSDARTGILSEAAMKGIQALAWHGNKNRTPKPPPPPDDEDKVEKDKVGAAHAYDGERQKVTRTGLVQMLYSFPDWEGVFWYDVLSRKIRVTDPPVQGFMTLERGEMSKGDLALVAHWLDCKGFLASKEMIEDAIWTVVRAPERQRNLIAEYLDALPPATEATLLPTLASDILGCTDPFANTLVMKTLVAAARRARNPGTFHKGMLVLKGAQGCGKTPFVKILAGPWYHSTGNGSLADRDTILECQGKFLVEVEELSAMNKADENSLKTAVSRTHDVITKKYEPDGQAYARSFVFIGTTNKDEFLTDSTGNERYWVVEVPKGVKIDLAKLEAVRDQVWAEADFLAKSGFANELEADEKITLESKSAEYMTMHPWEAEVARYLTGKTEVSSATEVLMHVLKGDNTKADKRGKNEVADIMRALGCSRVLVWSEQEKKPIRVWKVPPDIPSPKARVHPLRVVK